MSTQNNLPNKTVNAAGLAPIKTFESLRLNVYVDVANQRTIGYGHKLSGNEKLTHITVAEADKLLLIDVGRAAATVNSAVNVPLSQNQFNALVSFVFNIGDTAFRHSTLVALLNRGSYRAAADQMLRWDKATVGVQLMVVPGLRARRQMERLVFLGKN